MRDEGDLHAPRIVEAIGHAAGGKSDTSRGRLVEQAMAEATQKALDEGITDPDEIKARKFAARDAIRASVTTNTAGAGHEHEA